MVSGAYSSVEVRTIICDTLQRLFEDRQQLAYGLGNEPDQDAKIQRAWCLGEATGVGYAVDALAQAFGFESPWGDKRPEPAAEVADMPLAQRPTREIVQDGPAGGRHADPGRFGLTRVLKPQPRHRESAS